MPPIRAITDILQLGTLLTLALAGACRDARPVREAAADTVAGPAGARARIGVDVPVDGNWPVAAHDVANSRFSPLDEITVDNAGQLQLAWSRTTDLRKGHEAAPIVVDSTMYVVLPYPNSVLAIALERPDHSLRWRHEPSPVPTAQGVACCDVVNRGAAYANGRLFFNTLDNQTIALDTRTGRELWRTRLGDVNRGETMTMAPLPVKQLVLVGNSGGEFGVPGWLTALDQATGRIVWRAWSTGPDSLVLIGPRFRPFYAADSGRDLGVTTWPPDAWKMGGGGAWGWVAYDPALDLVYYGTANPGPWNAEQRPGDNKWTAGVFARDPDTGEAIWFYHTIPHDLWDHDTVNEQILVDLPVNGQERRVLLRPDRNGYMYLIDRATGEVLAADSFARITAYHGVDLETGRIRHATERGPRVGEVRRDICPASPGAKDWQPSAFSPVTGYLYVPHQTLCMDFEAVEANYIAGTPYVGANVKYFPAEDSTGGAVFAWDPVRRRKVWNVTERFPVWSGALVTAGNVMFYGTLDGWFKALDARTGKLLWQYRVESGIIGQPVSYRGPDGRQYVAVLSGIGGWPGALVSLALDIRDSTAANGWGAALPDLAARTHPGGALHVFRLP